MKFHFIFKESQSKEITNIIAHPDNEKLLKEQFLSVEIKIELNELRTNRNVQVYLSDIEAISSFTHKSKVRLTNGEGYYIKGRLKDLEYLGNHGLNRINNQEMINIKEVTHYSIDSGSRLIVNCKSGNDYIVSRYYAKSIKEKLKCGLI
ncbi:LytTR family DNA-binding domain-containing protein [Macrococcus brunensis]|uniref:LytTR family DNA-binding domain-containing protein n=1 Tax=Macrococcus brunensis TaxID=198483 RepID=UPI001EEFE8C5|nr:LytTR family DNA-binding domain-containing protein [Macrococcus brunensis]ULG72217.1 LytTR family transcriptional regulator [Macrococcus brunensis]